MRSDRKAISDSLSALYEQKMYRMCNWKNTKTTLHSEVQPHFGNLTEPNSV